RNLLPGLPMTSREDAFNQIISLAEAHHISADEIDAALVKNNADTSAKQTTLMVKLFYYIGSVFVFSGIGLFVSMSWDDIGSFSRVLLTLGPGLICFVLGCLSTAEERHAEASLPLWLIAALLQPTGLFVFL